LGQRTLLRFGRTLRKSIGAQVLPNLIEKHRNGSERKASRHPECVHVNDMAPLSEVDPSLLPSPAAK
jgi:hypothetical protein